MHDYMTTYEALLKLKNEKDGGQKVKRKKDKKKKAEKDIFDDMVDEISTRGHRSSVVNPEMSKNPSHDIRKPNSFFNMSGGRKESTDSDDYIKELEEENKRLKSLVEYKDYELNNKKDTDFGYDCFADLRDKFDASLKQVEDQNGKLRFELKEKDDVISQLQTELASKDEEISKMEDKYTLILKKQQDDNKLKIDELKTQLSTHSKEIVDEFKEQIETLKKELDASRKEKNKYLDEKLKIGEIIDQQADQLDYLNNKCMKLEDELSLRKQIENEVKANLIVKEEEIRVLKLATVEKVINSFDVKFINIEESKSTTEVLTKGTVQTCQSLENNKDFFLRLTYTNNKTNQVKSFKIDADHLGAIIPITDKRAAIQWKDQDGKK